MKWIRYLIYGVIFTAFIIFSGLINSSTAFSGLFSTRNAVILGVIIVAFIFGLLLGLEHLIEQANNKKSPWTFNIPRIIFMGIPSFLITLIGVLYASGVNLYAVPTGLYNSIFFFQFAAILLGYTILSNFEKKTV